MINTLITFVEDIYNKILWTLAVVAVIYYLQQPLLPILGQAALFCLIQLVAYIFLLPKSRAPAHMVSHCYNSAVLYALFMATLAKYPFSTILASIGF